MSNLNSSSAKKLIIHLKAGTTPIDSAHYLNVGNENWYKYAKELFNDIEQEGDSLVRFINGYYGDGKTHFLGMLRSIALNSHWPVSYVTAENTPLNKFHLVYSEIIKNITIPRSSPTLRWLVPHTPNGALAILYSFFVHSYIKIHGSRDAAGLDSMGVIQKIQTSLDKFTAKAAMDEMVNRALRGFVNAALECDLNRMNEISTWLEGGKIAIRDIGITRQINQTTARDIMRSISIIIREANFGGILILLDEAERIMEQTKLVRKKSYGVIRDMLDNADNQGGMRSSIIYIAATPDTFTSEKGFAEYDALRSRLSQSKKFSLPNFVDWRGVIVDLTETPLQKKLLISLAKKIRDIHAIARNWSPKKYVTDDIIKEIVEKIQSEVVQVSTPRMISSCIATFLDIAEQYQSDNITEYIDQILKDVKKSVLSINKSERWK